MTNKHELSKEQKDIIRTEGNVVVTARPGSGKTFTVVEKIKCISETLMDYQGIIAISFTRKASHELIVRCRRKNIMKKQSFLGTIDNFYLTQIIGPFAKHITRKDISLEVSVDFSKYPEYKELANMKNGITRELEELLIESLKEGHVFLTICGETALYILNNVQDCISYLKARYTHIFIDEYQDCGEVQHNIFVKLVAVGIIGFAVGDLDQAIYAFADRYSKYLLSLIGNKDFEHYSITKNYRCHKTISNYSLKLLGIDSKKENEVSRVFKVSVAGSDKQIMNVIDKKISQIKVKYNVNNNNEIAILCRSNITAVRANKFLKTKSKLFADTEFDKYNSYWGRLFNDLLQSYFDPNVFKIDFIEKYVDEGLSKTKFLKASKIIGTLFNLKTDELKKNLNLFLSFANMIYPEYENEEVVEVLQEVLNEEEKLISYKPAADDEVCILTLHKSKGLEFKIVFNMDLYRWILPFEYGDMTKNDYIQCLNLHYVGITRAIEVCYIMQGTERFRSKQADYINTQESEFLHIDGLSKLRNDVIWKI
ncbi:MAG: superfamily I DNA/RNA helicase [Clostridium sp.]|jgi:superfamily I DNA/RNA helicase